METHTSLMLYSVLVCFIISLGTNVDGDCMDRKFLPECAGIPYTNEEGPITKGPPHPHPAIRLQGFYGKIVNSNCHSDLWIYLCLLFGRPCEKYHWPCRELCLDVEASCGRVQGGWTFGLKCDDFSSDNCVGLNGTIVPKDETRNLTLGRLNLAFLRSIKFKCTPMKEPYYCPRAGGRSTLPNWAGDTNQTKALSGFLEMQPFMMENSGSYHLERFLCSVYFPKCRGKHKPRPPCRHVCYAAKRDWDAIFPDQIKPMIAGLHWPKHLHCERFPQYPPCEEFKREIPPSICITAPHSLLSSPMSFPEVEPESVEFIQYVRKCRFQCKALYEFACYLSLPFINGSTSPLQPCKSLCLAARAECELHLIASGSHWPDQICRFLPDSGPCLGNATVPQTSRLRLINPVEALRTPRYGSSCERIRLPTCMNLGYNQTSNLYKSPNFLHDLDQDEVYQSIRREMAIIEVANDSRCAQRFRSFICALALPRCHVYPDGRLPPCRPMCDETMMECRATFNTFNYKVPSSLRCRKLPSISQCINSFTYTNRSHEVSPSAKLPKVQYYCVDQTDNDLPPYAFVSITQALQPSKVSRGSQPRTNVSINIMSLDENDESGERCEWRPENDLSPHDAGVTTLKLQHLPTSHVGASALTVWLAERRFVVCPVKQTRPGSGHSWLVEFRENPLVFGHDDVRVHIKSCTDQNALKLSHVDSYNYNLTGYLIPTDPSELTPELDTSGFVLRLVHANLRLTPVREAYVGAWVRLVVSHHDKIKLQSRVLVSKCWASSTLTANKTQLIDATGCPTKDSPISEFKALNETVLQTDPFPLFTIDSRGGGLMDVTCSYSFCFRFSTCYPTCDQGPQPDRRLFRRAVRRSAGGQLQSQTIKLV